MINVSIPLDPSAVGTFQLSAAGTHRAYNPLSLPPQRLATHILWVHFPLQRLRQALSSFQDITLKIIFGIL
jgi:hypothetical protein